MGYRSEVGALFYVRDTSDNAKAKAIFDMWWQANMENCPSDRIDEFFREDNGWRFHAVDIKWYGSYADVTWFNNMAQRFLDELCHNQQLDGGSGLNKSFAYEFARVGEELDDNEYDRSEDAEWRLSVQRSLMFD